MCSLAFGRHQTHAPRSIRPCYTRWLIVGPMDKELALREDRRLLGRLLGEVIGAHVGEETRHRVETVRQSAVRFRRGESGQSELEAQLDALPIDQTLHVVRAFSYFSHLLNIAEDVQQNRRRHAHAEAGSPRRPGSITHALEKTEPESSIEEFISWFARARVSPVLTAHPTEVQRQSILECERARKSGAPPPPTEGAAREPPGGRARDRRAPRRVPERAARPRAVCRGAE